MRKINRIVKLDLDVFFRLYLYKILVGLLLIFGPRISQAQEFGGNPPSVKWWQIDTDSVRIIFQQENKRQAEQVANAVMSISRSHRRSIGSGQKKVDIVLQNQTLESNGYVGLAPFRSEFYITSPQNGFSLGTNWLQMLSLHEYRHVLQFANARRGITRLGAILTGQLGWSSLAHLSIPNWFFEGDAVMMETALSAQGRGRMPAFFNGYKSLVFDHKVYNYQKARNGSLKDYVPNHYKLGYLLCNYGRQEYGNDFWKDIVAESGAYKGLFYPFSKAVKRASGLNVRDFYSQAMRSYELAWNKELNSEIQDSTINQNKTKFKSYLYPRLRSDGTLIAYKVSFDKIGGFYQIDPAGKETLICQQGRVYDQYYNYGNDKLVWSEIGQDARWAWKTYANVVLYDLNSGKRRRLTRKKKYFSPDISDDGSKIVVFEVSPDHNNQLVIISSEDGAVISSIPNPEHYDFAYPQWSDNGKSLLVIARNAKGENALASVEPVHGKMTFFTPFTNHQIGIPNETKAYIYFAASFTGTDQIMALDKQTHKIFRVTNGALGAYQVVADAANDRVYYSRFSDLGNDLKSMAVQPQDWREISFQEPVNMDKYKLVAAESEGGIVGDSLMSKEYKVKRYRQTNKLINIHSWSFLFTDPNYEWALRSNNTLNTMAMNLGVRYNSNDKNFTYFLDAAYAQFFPVFTLSTTMSKRNTTVKLVDDQGNAVGSARLQWWESKILPGITIPLDFSSGLYSRHVSVGGQYAFSDVNFDKASEAVSPEVKDFNFQYYSTALSFTNRRKRARQNIYPSFSQYFSANFNQSVDNVSARQVFVDSEITLPGFSANHNLVFQVSYQHKGQDGVPSFSDNFVYARGYSIPEYDYIMKIGSNYHLPLWYPDWGFGGIAYFYRLRANVFYDYSRSYYQNPENGFESIQLYNSVGAEIVIDSRLMNNYDFTFGFRYSYLLNDDPFDAGRNQAFELFVPVLRF